MAVSITKIPPDLAGVVLLTVALVVTIGLDISDTVRVILGLPFVLFFPGYALVAALFVKKRDLDAIERIALSFGMSIAITPLVGLALNYTPFGIRLVPILASLALLILALCAVAAQRRARVPEAERFAVSIAFDFTVLRAERGIDRILTIILIIAAVIALVYVIAVPKTGEQFTQFYLLNANGSGGDYPAAMAWGETGSVILGITCNEHAETHYRWDLRLHNETIETGYVTLGHGETHETEVSFTITHPSDQKLEFVLFTGDAEALKTRDPATALPYRSVYLWVRDFVVLADTGDALVQPLSGTETILCRNAYLEKDDNGFIAQDYVLEVSAGGVVIAGESFTLYNETVAFPLSFAIPADAETLDVAVYKTGMITPHRTAVIAVN